MKKDLLSAKNLFIAIAFIALLVCFYYYLTNNRYMIIGDACVFDKWTGKAYELYKLFEE